MGLPGPGRSQFYSYGLAGTFALCITTMLLMTGRLSPTLSKKICVDVDQRQLSALLPGETVKVSVELQSDGRPQRPPPPVVEPWSGRPHNSDSFLVTEADSAAFSKAATCKAKTKLLSESVQTVITDTNPKFQMAVVDYPRDLISHWLAAYGTWDVMVLAAMVRALDKEPCTSGDAVVDVGANLGFFGLYAATRGCKVYGFEMQPPLQACINMSLCMSEKKLDYTLIPNPVSNVETTMHFNLINGEGNKGGHNVESYMNCKPDADGKGCTSINTVRIDDIVQASTIRVAKVDVEGWEWPVFQSFGKLISKKRGVQNVLFELTPYIHGVTQATSLLHLLKDAGMTLFELPFVQSNEEYLWPEMNLTRIPADISQYVMKLVTFKDHRNLGQADILATYEPEYFQVIPAQRRSK